MKRPFTDRDLNDFLKGIEAQKAYLLHGTEGGHGQIGEDLKRADEAGTAINAILHFGQYKRPSGRSLQTEEVGDYVEALKALNVVLADKNTPEVNKALMEDITRPRFYFGYPDPESPAVQAFFDMRDELPEDNPNLFRFIEDYIGALVYNRFYKAKDEGIKKRGEDPEDHDPKTPEGLKEANDESNKHFNELCREYGLNNHIREYDEEAPSYKGVKGGYIPKRPPFSFLDKRPQDYIDEVYGEERGIANE